MVEFYILPLNLYHRTDGSISIQRFDHFSRLYRCHLLNVIAPRFFSSPHQISMCLLHCVRYTHILISIFDAVHIYIYIYTSFFVFTFFSITVKWGIASFIYIYIFNWICFFLFPSSYYLFSLILWMNISIRIYII